MIDFNAFPYIGSPGPVRRGELEVPASFLHPALEDENMVNRLVEDLQIAYEAACQRVINLEAFGGSDPSFADELREARARLEDLKSQLGIDSALDGVEPDLEPEY